MTLSDPYGGAGRFSTLAGVGGGRHGEEGGHREPIPVTDVLLHGETEQTGVHAAQAVAQRQTYSLRRPDPSSFRTRS